MNRKSCLYLLLAGLLASLALPPLGIVPALLPGLLLTWRTVRQAGKWQHAFAAGWLFSFPFYMTSLYWISNALLVDADSFLWLVPFAVLLIPAYLALFPGVAMAGCWHLRGTSPFLSILVFASLWTLGEWLRSFYGMPFPWALTGSVWQRVLSVEQLASLVGVFGLSFLTIVFSLVMMLASWRGRMTGLFVLALAGIWGVMRLEQVVADEKTVVRLIQPNIPQEMKWDGEQTRANWKTLLGLSKSSVADIIIWPETASPYPVNSEPEARKQATAILAGKQYLLAGSNRMLFDGNGDIDAVYNSAFLINSQGRIISHYDKRYLVPFGEYIPLRKVMPLPRVVNSGLDFSRGREARILEPGTLPGFSPLICYESIFPGKVTPAHKRPDWLLNITNDAWFGRTAGAYQHLALARMRAIEEGLPLLRAANTGISAVIDSHGRLKDSLALETQGVIETPLPGKLPPTLYSKVREYPLWGAIIITLIAALWQARRVKDLPKDNEQE